MGGAKGILVFSRDDHERSFLSGLLKSGDCRIFDTPHALEALNILLKEDIGVVLADSPVEGMEGPEFKALVERIRPGTNTILFAPFTEKGEELSINTGELLKLIQDYTKTEGYLLGVITKLKHFSYMLADRLLQIFEVNNRYFFNNDHLVAELSRKIALRLDLEEDLVEAIRMAALLRDLGRVMIHHQILEETKRLNRSELMPIKAHPLHTIQILRQVRFPWNLDSIISQHHEHYDGNGYPMGIKGREICIGARIISVADAYYAMITDRPYRRAISKERALQEIKKNAGSQFDPEVVEVFLNVVREEPVEAAQKKNVLIFEREPNIAALIKLSAAADEISITHATSSIDVIGYIRHKNPDLVIADVEALDPDAFSRFFSTAQQITIAGSQRFLLITPDKDYPRCFKGNVDYIPKPLNIDELKTKIKSLLYEVQPSRPLYKEETGLTGDLKEFSLTDIIQILSLGLKTAKVEIAGREEKGILYLLHGKVVHASAGELRGPEAFLELIKWDEGKFYIIHGQTTEDVNVTVDTMHLLLEAITALDEKRGINMSERLVI